MNSQTQPITIGIIETKPEHDPYTNIVGITTRTYLKFDPRDGEIWVIQEGNSNSHSMDEWNGLILAWRVPGNPTEDAMRQWIEDNMERFVQIMEGYESRWDGSNHRGSLTPDARAVDEAIRFELDNDAGPLEHYEYWTVEAWVNPGVAGDIAAATTDDELRQMADDAITALAYNQVLDTDEDGVYEFLKSYRDELIEDDE